MATESTNLPGSGASEDLEKTSLSVPGPPIAGAHGDENQPGPESEDESEYPPLRTVLPIMAALYIAMFLIALDRIIIATAIPKITDEFHSISDIGWYASAYVLTSCTTQLLFARLYLFFSTKAVFVSAIFLFEVGSALCGAAPNSIAFIMGRAVAGCGSAGVYSGIIVITIPMVPLAKRPMYSGFLGAIFGVCSVVGPLVGGAFTSNNTLTWRWCFYINLPLGAISIALIAIFLHLSPPTKSDLGMMDKLKSMDPIGTLLFVPSVVSLLLALQWAGTEYPWSNPRIIALLILFGILFVVWITIQIYVGDQATVPPRVFCQQTIVSAVLFSACVGGFMLNLGYYIPIWFQAIEGVDAFQSGIRTLPYVLALVVAAIIAGGLVTKIGYYTPCVILGSAVMSVGAGLLTTLRVGSGQAQWIGYQVIAGFGLGLGMQQTGLAAQVVLAQEDIAVGASLMFFAQGLGGSILVCVSQNVFLQELIKNLEGAISDQGESISTLISQIGATQLRDAVPPELLPAVLQAYNMTIVATFFVGLAIACISVLPALGFEWKSVKGKQIVKGGGSVETGAKAVVR